MKLCDFKDIFFGYREILFGSPIRWKTLGVDALGDGLKMYITKANSGKRRFFPWACSQARPPPTIYNNDICSVRDSFRFDFMKIFAIFGLTIRTFPADRVRSDTHPTSDTPTPKPPTTTFQPQLKTAIIVRRYWLSVFVSSS